MDASFWTFVGDSAYVAAIPYTTDPTATGPYLWANESSANTFSRPQGSPGCRVGALVGQFLFLGDLYQQQQVVVYTATGGEATGSGTVPAPMQATGSIYDQNGALSGAFASGQIMGSGVLTGGTVDYVTGDIHLTFGSGLTAGDQVYASYVQAAPYRVWWSAIGDPTQWPVPLSNAALAAQSGYQDLDPTYGPVTYIAGYPQYALIFQRSGITRASYVGGQVVFSFQPYSFKKGVIAHGAAVQVGAEVWFLADDGFYVTDGANVQPFGTAPDNSTGIDRWFWANVNQEALEAIRSGYDGTKRCLYFAIPTGANTLPDTLLTYNVLAQRWSRCQIPVQIVWTDTNGQDALPATRQSLSIIDQASTPNSLTGPPLPGYLETVDLYDMSGNFRLTTGAIPQVESTDIPLVMMGTRDSLRAAVTYADGVGEDSFSGVAPVLSEGRYTRVRVSSVSATNFSGVTLIGDSRDGV